MMAEVMHIINVIEEGLTQEEIEELFKLVKYIALCDDKGSVLAILDRDKANSTLNYPTKTLQ